MNSVDVRIEKPRLSVPACLLVDDPAPCINPFYYYRLQVDGEGAERHEAQIPLAFLREFAAVCRAHALRGKFSVLPYPAGLGSILEGWEGCDRDELAAWLALVKAEIAPGFDISPELMTHTLALDLATATLLPRSEHEWLSERSPAELKQYFDVALGILRRAGFWPSGITQPVGFGGSRSDYARATLDAIRDAGGPPVTWFFIDGNFEPPPVPEPEVVLLDRERGAAVVDVMALCNDHFWPTQRVTRQRAEQVVDGVLSADGRAGRLAELAASGAWLLWVCHWQTLYSDGSREGLKALDVIAGRLRRAHGSRLLWLTVGEVARYRAASEGCSIAADGDESSLHLALDAAFDCPSWTISLDWRADEPPCEVVVALDSAARQLVADASPDGLLAPMSWRLDGERLYLCFDLQRGKQTIVVS